MTTSTIACKCGIVRKHEAGAGADPYRRCPVCGAEGREHWQWVSVPPETKLVGKEERAIGAIEFIEEEAAEWTGSDGGLTMAASDVLALAASAKKAIKEGNSHWVEWDDLLCGTSAEQDIREVVYNYFQ